MGLSVFLLLFVTFSFGQNSTFNKFEDDDDLTKKAVEEFQIENKNIQIVLSELAYKYDIPIGLEVAKNDDLLQESNNLSIEIKQGTLKDIFDSIVVQNTRYTWTLEDGVVNFFPKELNKDIFLQKILDSKIENYSVKKGGSRIGFRNSIVESKEIKSILFAENVTTEEEIFSSRDLSPLGKNFHFEKTTIKVKDLLNQVIKVSETKYWVITRYGENKQFLLINL